MKSICQFSGLPLYKSQYLPGFDLADIHPIFRARKKLLLTPDMTHRFTMSENPDEKKLIMLAVWNTTELVDFRCPANPDSQTVETNFYRLMHTAGWLAFAEYTYKAAVSFPRFVVSPDTCNLKSLPGWIRACEDIKEQVIKKDLDRDRAASLAQKAAEVQREINEATFLNRAFTPSLARWALEFAGVKPTEERFLKWIKLLCAPLSDAWVFDVESYKDIEEAFELELPYDHPQVISVMAQLRALTAACRKGFKEFAVFNDDDLTGESFVILDDNTEARIPSRHTENVPTSEPRRENFPTKLAYLVASAKWKLANRNQTPPTTLSEDSI